jgi:hypothetical protein
VKGDTRLDSARVRLESSPRACCKAGAANYVWALELGEFVGLNGPPRLQPRPHWRRSTSEALALLTPLPDDKIKE